MTDRDWVRVWTAYAVLLPIASLPVLSTILPPLVDYPNHLARMFLLATGGNAYFQPHWSILPNLAEDVFVPLLAHLVPLGVAAKLFLITIFALTTAGTLCLNRMAAGRWQYWPLVGFLLLYNRSFLWGFLNYSFGAGLALFGLALWLALERAPAGLRIALSALVAICCYFSHIEAFCVYAIALCGLELPPVLELAGRKEWAAVRACCAMVGSQFIVPAVLYGMSWHAGTHVGWNFGGYGRKADLLFSVFDNYDRPFDVTCFVIFIATLVYLFVRRWVLPVPRVMAAASLLFAVYLVIPSQLLSGSGADHRLPPTIFLLVIAGATENFPKSRGVAWLAFGALLLFALRWAAIERVWLSANAIYRSDIAVLDQLAPGARLAVAFPPEASNMVPVPLLHLPTLAIVRRGAFVPTLFTFPTQQPIRLTDTATALMVTTPENLWDALMQGVTTRQEAGVDLRAYDNLVVLDRRPFDWNEDPCFKPLSLSADFKLFWIDHPVCDEERAQQLRNEAPPDAAPSN